MDGARLGTISVPATGGWQSWRTESLTGVSLEAGEHTLRLSVGRRGDFNLNTLTFMEASGVAVGELQDVPEFGLEALYPNPTRGSFSVRFALDQPGAVQLEVFDVTGRRVASRPMTRPTGAHEELLDTSKYPAGLYAVRLTSATRTATQPLLAIR